jgi:uncharacterized surface protein with fasciclin (FAS1) repeats
MMLGALLIGLGAGTVEGQDRDLVETAAAAGGFETLLAAAQAAGLVETLRGAGPFTVFAPTDEAFAALPAGTVEGLLKDRDALRAVLLYHVVPARVTSAGVAGVSSAETVHGASLRIRVSDGRVQVGDDATVVQADVLASNGVIHVIDRVLLPPME